MHFKICESAISIRFHERIIRLRFKDHFRKMLTIATLSDMFPGDFDSMS